MAQIFSSQADRRLRRSLLAAPVLIAILLGLGFYQFRSGAHWGVGETIDQPIGFRHDIHVSELGLDCGYCHTGAQSSSAAGMPTTATCLGCHSRIWRGVDALQALFTSVELDQPIKWSSLYGLPEHTHFHHGAHAASGITCFSCHGDVATMAKTRKTTPMSMSWCLECHENVGEGRQDARIESLSFASRSGRLAAKELAFANPRLTDCSTCHY